MDKVWLLNEGLEAILDDCESYGQTVAADVFQEKWENGKLAAEHVRRLYRILRKGRKRLQMLEQECKTGIAFIRWTERVKGNNGTGSKPTT